MEDFLTDPDTEDPAVPAVVRTHSFRGQPLQPFSIMRQTAAQMLGNKLLSGRARLEEGGAYDGMVLDVFVLLYLCTSEPPAVSRALERPAEGRAAAIAWAEREGLALGSALYREACTVFFAILHELQAAQFTTEPPEGGPAPNV